MTPARLRLLLLLLSIGAQARAQECVFYLKPSRAGLEGRLYDPARDRDFAPEPRMSRASGVLWDPAFARVYWLDGAAIRRAWWLGLGRPEPPIALPAELRAPEAWWLGPDGLMLVRRERKSLELWRHDAEKRIWELVERDRTASATFFQWSRQRRDAALAARLQAMTAGAYLSRIQWSGRDASGAGFLPLRGAGGCGLKLRVDTDAQGAHIVAPLEHRCPGSKKSRTLLGAPPGGGVTQAAFAQSGPWLLVGREPAMQGARVLSVKSGALRKALPAGASDAAWVPCPAHP